jgi:hypothetical protein
MIDGDEDYLRGRKENVEQLRKMLVLEKKENRRDNDGG